MTDDAAATHLSLDGLSPEDHERLVGEVLEYLTVAGYTVFEPAKLAEHIQTIRADTLQDAAELALQGHGRRQTMMQFAIALKNLSDRIRTGAKR